MRTVQDILHSKAKPFNQTTPGTLVYDALNLLNSLNLSYLVVVDDNAYKGIFSERDYSRKVILKGRNSSTTTVAEVMSTDVPVVSLTDSVERCMHLMEQSKSRYLLVFDDQKQLLGVVTIHDIMRQIIKEKSENFNRELAQKLVDDDEKGQIY